jgi:hypothetical protein
MTVTAFPFKLTQVGIFMAIFASGSQGFIHDGFTFGAGEVTFITFEEAVFPGQRVIAGLVVIGTLFESLHHVAGPAVLLELSPVRVFAVTVAAIGKRQLAVFLPPRVALAAGDSTVSAPQRVSCTVMVIPC